MDQDRFFFEVDRSAAEIDNANGELQILADDYQNSHIEAAYSEFLQAIMAGFYDTDFE